jgi:hypothetical protein
MSIQMLHAVSATENARIAPSPSIEQGGPQGGRRRRFTLIARATNTAPARPLEVPERYDRSLVRAEGGAPP